MRKELRGWSPRRSTIRRSGRRCWTGRAAAVFFHEVFGIAPKGTVKKSDRGTTFSKKVGEQILRSFWHYRQHDDEKKSASRTFWATTSLMMKAWRRARGAGGARCSEEFRDVAVAAGRISSFERPRQAQLGATARSARQPDCAEQQDGDQRAAPRQAD